MMRLVKKIITAPVDWVLYSLLNEQQRKKITDKLSDRQKAKIKRLIGGRKQAQRQKLKQIKHHLYNLGFTEKALEDLKSFHHEIKDKHLKRLAAWELVLWYANLYTEAGARQALDYIPDVIDGELDRDQLRRAAIIKAECYERVNKIEDGKQVLQDMLGSQKHPDLYLGMANLEASIMERVKWINKAMSIYDLQPITFGSNENPIYDDIKNEPLDKKIEDGPKVSVIFPAYQAESGIGTAIESILAQTWQNLELLVVDDCSPDNTAAVISDYAKKDSRVKLLSTPVNSGPYVARNIALAQAAGEFITINDADDWSHMEKIEIQVKHLMDNKNVIANTSEHARLTEELQLYRRGTPGKYIFPNMSSIMFRCQPVMEKIGFWDSVRFAADGEFKRRLIKVFGKAAYMDLETGPLSLPRQAVASLTSSSVFGYNGFFMGVRKEYVESLEHYHAQADTLYYDFPQETRPFPVPEPMWPQREDKQAGIRQMDIVVVSDFRQDEVAVDVLQKLRAEQPQAKIGFVQIYRYDLNLQLEIDASIRNIIDGNHIQMLVYGEKIKTNKAVILNEQANHYEQLYIPEVIAKEVDLVIQNDIIDAETLALSIESLCNQQALLIPYNNKLRKQLLANNAVQANFALAKEDWVTDNDA